MADQDEDKRRREAEDRAQRNAMQGWIHSTFRDPEFRAFPGAKKIQIMEEADPEFKAIPTMADKARVVQSYLYRIPQGMPSTGSAWRDFAESFAGAALTPVITGGDIVAKQMGYEPLMNRPEIRYWLSPAESMAGKAGALAEPVVEALAMPELKATKIPKLLRSGQALMREGLPVLRETIPSFLRRSAFEGAKMGTQAYLHGDQPVPGAILGASGPTLGYIIRNFVSPQASASARWLYNRALNPTKQVTKAEAQEVVPELLQRKFWASTFPRLQTKVEENLKNAEANLTQAEDQAVRDLENTYIPTGRYRTVQVPGRPPTPGPTIDIYPGEAAPPGAPRVGVGESVGPRGPDVGFRAPPEGTGGTAASSYRVYETQRGAFSLQPVLDALQDVMKSAHVGGRFPTQQSEQLYHAALNQWRRLAQFGRFVPLRDAIKIRRILDKPLGQKGTFYLDPKWQSLERVQEIAANRLRGLINDNFPELKNANHQYHLWKTTAHIMGETERRKIGQVGLMHLLATAIPAGVHVAGGADVALALKGVVLANAAAAVANSPGLQTIGGVGFQALADALESRNLERFLAAAGTLVRPRQEDGDAEAAPPLLGPGSRRPAAAAPAGGRGGRPAEAATGGGRGAPVVVPTAPAAVAPPAPAVTPTRAAAAPARPEPQPPATIAGWPAARIRPSDTPPPGTTWEYWGLKPPSGVAPAVSAAPARPREPAPPTLGPSRPATGRFPSWDRTARFLADFQRSGQANQVPPAILRAVAFLESAGNPEAVGSSGEKGLMQLMPATAKALGVDPTNVQQSIQGAGKLLGHLWRKYKGDKAAALAAYNMGEPAFDRRRRLGKPLPEVTRQYVVNGLYLLEGVGRPSWLKAIQKAQR